MHMGQILAVFFQKLTQNLQIWEDHDSTGVKLFPVSQGTF
jgi:hypothetical protein